MADASDHERAREQTLSWLVAAVRRGDYSEAAQWLETLAAVDDRFEISGPRTVARWHQRAKLYRQAGRVPDPLTVEGAAADYRGMFGALLKHSFDGIAVNARGSQWFLEVSDSFCELTGYRREQLIGWTAVDLGLVADDAIRAEIVRRTGVGLEGVYRRTLRRKDGAVRIVEFSQQLLPGDELVISIIRDITDRPHPDEIAADSDR
ncbi:PAS domain S-box protein [Nocardia sp. NPDC052112]|uniref:PAS domain S-box protein n=1 Tax=Nocardia sp. NPDC052112 TaxID=3155646 RepID=UPI003421F659